MTTPVGERWRLFLIDHALAENHKKFFMIDSVGVQLPTTNPILERLLPSLLHVKALTLLDAALKEGLAARGEAPVRHGYRDDLNGRINTAGDLGLILDCDLLHEARKTRNDIAHEFEPCVDWAGLRQTILVVHDALSRLGMVGAMPRYEVTGERKPTFRPDDPETRMEMSYLLQVLENGKEAAAITWSKKFGPIGGGNSQSG